MKGPKKKRGPSVEAAAEPLRETAERLRSLLEGSRDVIYRYNLQEGRYEYVSPSAQAVMGFSPEEFMALDANAALAMIHPDDLAGMQSAIACLETNNQAEAEYRQRTKSGEYRWLSNQISLRRDEQGKPLYRDGSIRDVTERKRAQGALREKEAHLTHAQQIANIGSWEWDIKADVLVWSEQVYRIMGEKPGDFTLRHDSFYERVHPEDRARYEAALKKSLAGKAAYDLEVRIVRPDKSVRVLHTRGEVELGADGQPCRMVGVCIDITKRERAEEALRESEEFNRSLVEKTTAIILRVDPQARITFANRRALEFFGYSRQELLGKAAVGTIIPDRESSGRDLAEMVKGIAADPDKYHSNVNENMRKNGERVWLEWTNSGIYDSHGRLKEFLAVGIDITERKRAEEALAAAHRKLQGMIDNTPAIVYAFDLEERFMMANKALAALLNSTPEQMLGRRRHEFMPKEDAEWHEANDRQVIDAGHALEFEEHSQLKGRSITWLTTKFPLRDGQGRIYAVAGISADISERKKAEEELRQVHERLEYHVRNTPLAVIEFDSELRLTAWNEGAKRIFGWEASEVLGKSMWDLPWIPEEDRSKIEKISTGLRTGETQRSVSPNRNVRKDGKVIWCEWYNSSLTNKAGKMQSIQSLVLDVTQRHEFEAELQRLVDERTTKLREMVSELEHFSYTITHDMRAPLRGMQGFAEMMAETCANCKQQDAIGFLQRIRLSGERMDALITDALNYNRTVRQELPLALVDLPELLRGMLDSYPEFQTSKADITIEGQLPVVLGNQAGLTQCFSNLLGNAVKFVKPGQKPEIRIRAEQREGWVRVWVEDKGIGIHESLKARVFDMFSRGSKKYEGTGIGLALVRKVIQHMDGRVGVESEEGKGSQFWFELQPGDARNA